MPLCGRYRFPLNLYGAGCILYAITLVLFQQLRFFLAEIDGFGVDFCYHISTLFFIVEPLYAENV